LRRRQIDVSTLDAYVALGLLLAAPQPFRQRAVQWRDQTRDLLDRSSRALRGATLVRYVRQAQDLEPMCSRLSQIRDDPNLQLRAARLVREKPGRRALVEYDVSSRGTDTTIVGKIRAKGVDRTGLPVLRALRDAGVSVPDPIGELRELGMTLQLKLDGVPSTALLHGPSGVALARRIVDELTKLHRAGVPTVRTHSLDDELRILELRLDDCDGTDEIIEMCRALAATIPTSEPCGIHRDFYPDQVLVCPDGRIVLLDLDLYCTGDAALDAGNFVAHLTEQSLREDGDPCARAAIERAFEDRFVGDSRRARALVASCLRAAFTGASHLDQSPDSREASVHFTVDRPLPNTSDGGARQISRLDVKPILFDTAWAPHLSPRDGACSMDLASVRRKLAAAGQEHVLRFFDQLDTGGRQRLFAQIEQLDLDHLRELVETHVKGKGPSHLPKDIQPAPAYPRVPRPEQKQLYADAERRGLELLQQGKVAGFLVAGGQGTGWVTMALRVSSQSRR
jgi:hypothetical protein